MARSFSRGPRDAAQLQRELDVLAHGAMGEQRQRLEHHAGRPAVGRDVVDAPASQQDVAGRGLFQPGQHAQQRRLARSGGPHDGEELALVDVEIDAVDGGEVAEVLGQRSELQNGGTGHGISAPCQTRGSRGRESPAPLDCRVRPGNDAEESHRTFQPGLADLTLRAWPRS
jgi:hypothetical protein